MDLISGSWPGEVYLFKGGPNHTFAKPVMLKHKQGDPINVGGGIEERADGSMLVRGKVDWETTDEGTVVVYRGKRIKSTPEKPLSSTGTASTVRAADWDGDGDMDLIVGSISGEVHWIPNEGTPEAWAFGQAVPLKVGSQPLDVGGRAGPFAADWDGDGDLDLIVGAENGSVSLFANTGTRTAPILAKATEIVPPGQVTYGPGASKTPQRGSRAKVCVADWNGDGKLDLLVGDMATQKPDLPDPTPDQVAEYDRLRKALEPLNKRYSELIDKLMGQSRVRTEKERAEVQAELQKVGQHMQELQSRLPRDYETHGWVWLFLRK
ncbi:MAG: FG-GAP-like repeat-containing protein [Phycisphaerae bacterium]|nr:FG-GAP-like repeat-containing protein [Phycisphaerae bacterium]